MAFNVLSRTIESSNKEMPTPEQLKEAARILSLKGASEGGKERARRLSAKRRTEIAKNAAKERWSKVQRD